MATKRGAVWFVVTVALAGLAADAGEDATEREATHRATLAKLDVPVEMHFKDAPLEDVLKSIRSATKGPGDTGVAIYVDPVGLQEERVTMTSPVTIDAKGEPLKTSLARLLMPLGLSYAVKDGLVVVTSRGSQDVPLEKPK